MFIKSVLLFVLAGLLEIGGGYLMGNGGAMEQISPWDSLELSCFSFTASSPLIRPIDPIVPVSPVEGRHNICSDWSVPL